MYLKNFIIEVTRKCNMQCEHCIRGDAQNSTMDIELLRKFFVDNCVNKLGNVTFSGGEVFLEYEVFNEIVDLIIELEITIDSYTLATNGTIWNGNIEETMLKLYNYCNFKDRCFLIFSRDVYHDINEEIVETAKKLDINVEDYEINNERLIKDGRASDLGVTIQNVPTYNSIEDFETGYIYISSLGEVCPHCNFSYDRMAEVKLFNVNEKTIKEYLGE